jgi:hypothetical protein
MVSFCKWHFECQQFDNVHATVISQSRKSARALAKEWECSLPRDPAKAGPLVPIPPSKEKERLNKDTLKTASLEPKE